MKELAREDRDYIEERGREIRFLKTSLSSMITNSEGPVFVLNGNDGDALCEIVNMSLDPITKDILDSIIEKEKHLLEYITNMALLMHEDKPVEHGTQDAHSKRT